MKNKIRHISIKGKCPKCDQVHDYSGLGALGAVLVDRQGDEVKTQGFCIGLDNEEFMAALYSVFRSTYADRPNLFLVALQKFAQETNNMNLVIAQAVPDPTKHIVN
jgi:hypothetical protein